MAALYEILLPLHHKQRYMKFLYKNLLLILLLALTKMVNAQLVVTEISYNPPEAGTDSLEYIEVYNNTGAVLNLDGFSIKDAVEYEFTGSLAANSYLVITKSASAMQAVFGINAVEWGDGSLNNGGEALTIVNASGDTIDFVNFDDSGAWPREADGTDGRGASIELCDLNSDNSLAESWKVSKKTAGVLINDLVVFGSPATINQCEVVPVAIVTSNTDLKFTPSDITIHVGETVRFQNKGGNHNVNGSIQTYPDNPVGFGFADPSSENWVYDYTFIKTGLYKYVCDPHASFNMVGTVTVKTLDITSSFREIPQYQQLVVYPNPTTGKIILEGERDYETIQVFNTKGELVQVMNPGRGWDFQVDLSQVPVGVYFVKATSGTKAYLTKVVKK